VRPTITQFETHGMMPSTMAGPDRPFVLPPPRRVTRLVQRSRHTVADHGVFRVERLEYETLPRDVFVYQCPDWCNVIAETSSGEAVFVWQHRFGTNALSLEIPGGIIDPGETPEEAAHRELREETGYVAAELEFLSVVEPNPAMQGNRCYTFVAKGARKLAETSFDELEDLEVTLVPLDEMAALLDSGSVTHALVVCALETYLRKRTRR
jgi:ADP-ribose pyrophosphatase